MDEPIRILTTDDVTIKTLAVEVKVMKIDKRQVTLAVFRQLPEEPILDILTGELIGIPWGRVNYCPDCKNTYPHFHIVWQKGNKLCRATIETRWSSGPSFSEDLRIELLWGGGNPLHDLNYYVESYLCARTLQGWLPDKPAERRRGKEVIPYMYVMIEGHHYMFELDTMETHLENLWKAMRRRVENKEALMSWEQRAKDDPDNGYYQRTANERRAMYTHSEEAYQDCYKKSLEMFTMREFPQDPQRVFHDYLLPAYHDYLLYVQRWKDSYAQLEALDQLFIAV